MVETAEAGVEALGLKGHTVLVEGAHQGPQDDLAILELKRDATLL